MKLYIIKAEELIFKWDKDQYIIKVIPETLAYKFDFIPDMAAYFNKIDGNELVEKLNNKYPSLKFSLIEQN